MEAPTIAGGTDMDLGIQGKSALVLASSRGLGFACAAALVREGCAVTLNGRDAGRLAEAARQIASQHSARVAMAVGDICTEAGRAVVLAACPDADILVTNNEGPPPGELAD